MFETSKLFGLLFRDRYRVGRHLILQGVIFIITIGNFFDAPDTLNFTTDRIYSWIAYYLFLNMIIYFNVYVLFPIYLAKGKTGKYMAGVAAFMVFAFFVMMVIQDLFYDISVMHTQPGPIEIILSILSSVFSLTLFLGGSSVYLLLKRMIINTKRMDDMKMSNRSSRLAFLKNQINPHFLFNMINNANILADDEPDSSSHILRRLNEIIRYQLNDSLQERVSLGDDIRFLTNYLELEKTRRDEFSYSIEGCDDAHSMLVPPFIFIPFVENAVKHNVTGGRGFVNLSFSGSGNRLRFTCLNSTSSVVNRNNESKPGGLGLENIEKRLDLYFSDKYTLEKNPGHDRYEVILEITVE